MAQPTLRSNNPFRRNGAGASAPAAAPPPFGLDALEPPSAAAPSPSSSEQFRSHLQALSQPVQPPSATSLKPKVVKKVRVQSPPPSSPESAGAPESYLRAGRYDDSDTSEDEEDEVNPFSTIPPRGNEDEQPADRPPSTPHRAPPNPFQRTLQDIELGSDGTPQSPETLPGARGALDVDAFQRLLLTGQAGPAAPAQSTGNPPRAGDGANQTDTSSLPRQSLSGASTHPSIQDTPRTSHEISDREADDSRHDLTGSARPNVQTPTLRKKPPPPSSRHGKLIRPEPAAKGGLEDAPANAHGPSALSTQTPREGTTPLSSPLQASSTPLKVNKPLPVPPNEDDKIDSVRGEDGAAQIPAEMTADEILPVPPPPTPPKASIPPPPSTTPQIKKPPPPPRRQPHGRSESRASIQATAASPPSVHNPEERDLTARRSSQDSTRSRSSSLRVSIHAPAPPPPRRPAHHSRPSNSFMSPSSLSFSSLTPSGSERSPSELPEFSPLPTPSIAAEISAAETPVSSTGAPHHKHFPPPPPPARNASTRSKRPPSVHSVEAPTRRMSSHAGLPPPPPPRQRGGSKGSVDGVVVGPKPGVDAVRILEGTFAEEPEGSRAAEEPGASTDILADLTALQREVDALRGKVAKGGTEV
jgi:hypothetical protein